jgi:hypothetical protein
MFLLVVVFAIAKHMVQSDVSLCQLLVSVNCRRSASPEFTGQAYRMSPRILVHCRLDSSNAVGLFVGLSFGFCFGISVDLSVDFSFDLYFYLSLCFSCDFSVGSVLVSVSVSLLVSVVVLCWFLVWCSVFAPFYFLLSHWLSVFLLVAFVFFVSCFLVSLICVWTHLIGLLWVFLWFALLVSGLVSCAAPAVNKQVIAMQLALVLCFI